MENDPKYKNKEEEVKLLSYLEKMPSEKLANYLFHNQQDKGFVNRNTEWGLDEKPFSNGVIYSDLDNDGDLDLVVNNLEDYASIYRNNNTNSNFIGFELEGKDKNIPIGARIHLKASGKYQMQEFNLSRGYLSSVSPRIHFGLGDSTNLDEVVIEWPDGNRSRLVDVKVNKYNKVVYKKTSPKIVEDKDESIKIKQFETIAQ